MVRTVAALFVETGGPYFGIAGVDPWDVARDARKYTGPHPVVAHPPCERWGRYWSGGPSVRVRRVLGDDGGCFASALISVRRFGGVLEHPEASHAWRAFGIARPVSGRWIECDGGWTTQVEQGRYGHKARKKTWLYVASTTAPQPLDWSQSVGVRLDEGFHSTMERRGARARGVPPLKRISRAERIHTPIPFLELLISIARQTTNREGP